MDADVSISERRRAPARFVFDDTNHRFDHYKVDWGRAAYHCSRGDSCHFIESAPSGRMFFASETGLFCQMGG